MSIFRYIRDNCRVDTGYLITDHEFRELRIEYIGLRRKARRMMREFKRQADRYLIPTRWNRPYKAMKQWFKERKGR